jgi:FkbH-like protein
MTIAISATFTADPVAEVVELWCGELGLPARVELAPYHQVFQQLLDPASLLRSNRQGANVVLTRIEDWAPERDAARRLGEPESMAAVERAVTDLLEALEEAARAMAAPLLVFVCPCSPEAAAVAPFHALLAELEARLGALALGVPNLYVISAAELAALYPVETLHDPYADHLGHIPYTPAGFAALGTLVARKVYATTGPPAKVIALDCDQTLWKGVCGEDGPEGVVLDEPRRRLQEFVLAQRQAGTLLCLCSKNQEEDVWSTFDRRSDFPLGRRDLTAWRINWSPKSENLRGLAAELGLGLDSFVLIDDNPVECAEVRAGCPQAMVLELPVDEREILKVLQHFWAFDRLRTTAEDRGRAELYGQALERERHRRSAGSFAEFLAGLELAVDILPLTPEKLERTAQLTQRTNQFNASTIRRTEGEIQRLLADGALECRVVEVRDRFGDYGLVGVVLFAVRPLALAVDTFLLSCRVLGRGVEHRVLSELAREAAARGVERIDVPAVPTARNRPALDFLRGIPGAREEAAGEGGLVFRLPAVPVDSTHALAASEDAPAPSRERENDGGGPPSRSDLLLRIATGLSDPLAVRRRIVAGRTRPGGCVEGGVPPRGAAEERLARLFAEVLGIERMGAHDSFFDLGVHSLPAAQVISRIRETFGVELTLRSFFAAPTLAGLATEIERRHGSGGAPRRPAIADFRQERGSPPPLSIAQEHFWLGRRLEARSVASTIPVLLRFEGDLDVACLGRALREIVDRHEVLRTSFREDASGAVQVIHPEVAVHLSVVDLERVPPREEIRRWSTLDGRTHFDFERAPLFRLTLFRCAAREQILLFTVHHIAYDGWSDSVLLGELAALYAAFRGGRPSPLPPLSNQYQDFARWQRRTVTGEALENQVAFWREHLHGARPLDFRGDGPPPLHPTFAAGLEAFTVPAELERRLEAFAAEHQVTLFMMLLAAFKALLRRETEQDDIVVTCLFANRTQVEIENLIGNFFTALPLRTRLSGAGTFRELLARVRDVTLAAHEHPDFLPGRVMEGRAPFRIMFQLAKLPPAGLDLPGLKVVRQPFDTGKIRQDLTLFLTQSDRLAGRFKYNRDVLAPERVAGICAGFLHILAEIVADPGREVVELARASTGGEL